MKAVDEIGLKKTLKFAVYSFLQVIYHLCFLPPSRKMFLILLGAKIGKHSILMNVNFFNWHHKGISGFKVGNECFIGDETLIDLYDQVILEDQVTLAQRVTVLTHLNVGYKNHPLQKFFPKMSKPVIFKNGCVVGAAAKILPGVTIGEKSFVGAGAVVTSDIPKESVYAGVPAKLIRKIK
jgi:acetyltransferase-like isoleucine patch superfamily enzyme